MVERSDAPGATANLRDEPTEQVRSSAKNPQIDRKDTLRGLSDTIALPPSAIAASSLYDRIEQSGALETLTETVAHLEEALSASLVRAERGPRAPVFAPALTDAGDSPFSDDEQTATAAPTIAETTVASTELHLRTTDLEPYIGVLRNDLLLRLD